MSEPIPLEENLNLLFLIISKFEVFALSLNINPKFGLSLFAVAQKKVLYN